MNMNNIHKNFDTQKIIFNNSDYEAWDGSSKLKILTHHWGNDWNKGFDVYSKIDNLLANECE